MKKLLLATILACLSLPSVHAQFGRRVLKKELQSTSFVPLKFQALNDSIISGYGFPNPTGPTHIVFTETQPTGDKTEAWSEEKVKYVELYTGSASTKDTLKLFLLRNMRAGIAKSLNTFIYENDAIRLFEAVDWPGYYAKHPLIFYQTTERPVYDSDTYFLNFNKLNTLKRSAKRRLGHCTELMEKINNGDYFPSSKAKLKKFADDYASLCATK